MAKRNKKSKKRGKRYADYTPEMLEMALEAMRSKKMSSYQAEKAFRIPRRTLLDKLNNKHPLKSGGQTWLKKEEEDDIVKVLIAAGDFGSPLGNIDLRIMVHRYLTKNNKSVFGGKLPGEKWVNWFLKRNDYRLTSRATQNIKRSRAEKNPDEMTEYFQNLEKSLKDIPKENIVNYDETNLSDDPGSTKCIFRRGVKYPERVMNFSKGAISIMFAISAGGECLQPYVVYKAEHLYQQWTINGPKGARYNRSKSGWFDSTIFEDWFITVVLPWAKNKLGPKILIGDNLASHINVRIVKLCEDNDIRFVFLPPNSSHLTQPLDVCYFGPLKKLWRATLLNYKTKNPREASINKSHFPELLKQLMIALDDKTANIHSAFKSTGIYPLNSHEVLKKLPGYKYQQEEYSVDQALLDYLKESRAPDPMKKIRNKKLKVPPGKSVASEDFRSETDINSNSAETANNNSPNLFMFSEQDLSKLDKKAPETLKNMCLQQINQLFTAKVTQKPKIVVLENKLLTRKTHTLARKLKSEQITKLKRIDKKAKIQIKGKHEEVNKVDQIKIKQEKAEKVKDNKVQNNIGTVKIRDKTNKKKKRQKYNDYESETSEEYVSSESDEESWDVFRKRLLRESIETEKKEQKDKQPDVEISKKRKGSSTVKQKKNMNNKDELSKGTYVIVAFDTTKTVRHFVGKVEDSDDAGWKIRFLRKKSNFFIWPLVDDYSYVLSNDIITALPIPVESRRGKLSFDFDFTKYTL